VPSPFGVAKTRAANQLQIGLDNIDTLKRNLSASRLNLQPAQAKIRSLTSQLGKALQEVSDVNPTQSPSDCTYLDIVKNHECPFSGCRYSLDRLVWAQQFHAISPSALDFVRRYFQSQENCFLVRRLLKSVEFLLTLFRNWAESENWLSYEKRPSGKLFLTGQSFLPSMRLLLIH
jgi:hypothetical protein